jgi:hypothetical protein
MACAVVRADTGKANAARVIVAAKCELAPNLLRSIAVAHSADNVAVARESIDPMRLAIAIVIASAWLSACVGMRGFAALSQDCRARISHCMGQCAPEVAPSHNTAFNGPTTGFDSRSDCQRRCDAICN